MWLTHPPTICCCCNKMSAELKLEDDYGWMSGLSAVPCTAVPVLAMVSELAISLATYATQSTQHASIKKTVSRGVIRTRHSRKLPMLPQPNNPLSSHSSNLRRSAATAALCSSSRSWLRASACCAAAAAEGQVGHAAAPDWHRDASHHKSLGFCTRLMSSNMQT